MYKVIDGNELMEEDYPGFYRGEKTEEDFVDFLGSSGVMVGENHPHSQYLCRSRCFRFSVRKRNP